MRLGFPEIAPQCVSLVGAPWINRQLNLMAHPRLADVEEVKQAHLAVRVVRMASSQQGALRCWKEPQVLITQSGSLTSSSATTMPRYPAPSPHSQPVRQLQYLLISPRVPSGPASARIRRSQAISWLRAVVEVQLQPLFEASESAA